VGKYRLKVLAHSKESPVSIPVRKQSKVMHALGYTLKRIKFATPNSVHYGSPIYCVVGFHSRSGRTRSISPLGKPIRTRSAWKGKMAHLFLIRKGLHSRIERNILFKFYCPRFVTDPLMKTPIRTVIVSSLCPSQVPLGELRSLTN